MYAVTEHYCGTFYDSLFITVNPLPEIDLGADEHLLLGESVDFSVSSGMNYLWWPSDGLNCNNCSSVIAQPDSDTEYFLTVTDTNGCSSTDSVLVTVLVTETVFIPNTFTPDGDGVNEVFKPSVYGILGYYLMIFDRWGELFFETSDENSGWDGTHLGLPVQNGTYVYALKGVDLRGENREWRGHINVLR